MPLVCRLRQTVLVDAIVAFTAQDGGQARISRSTMTESEFNDAATTSFRGKNEPVPDWSDETNGKCDVSEIWDLRVLFFGNRP